MWSKLSSGIRNAPGYDQAARTVACIAETVRRADTEPQQIERLAFFVVAPLERIKDAVFGNSVNKPGIRQRVQDRVDGYKGDKNKWFDQWFLPTLDAIDLRELSWEELLEGLEPSYRTFYDRCLLHNKPKATPERRRRSGGRLQGSYRQTLMVYCPEIYPDSFVHLSIRGESYKFRAYSGPKRFNQPWQEPGVSTVSELRDRFRFVHEDDVTIERKSVNEREYWQRRTIEFNRKHGVQGRSDR